MEPDNSYFSYLTTRSTLAKFYRNFFLYRRINRHLKNRVLDVGCGIGDFIKFRGNTIGLDINEMVVDYYRRNGLNVYHYKDDKFPFDDNSFDGVVLDNVIEHIENPESLINEIKRVLKLDGVLVVGVPGIKGYNADADHKNFYDEIKLVRTFTQHAFIKKKSFHAPLFKSKWLSSRMSQYCIYIIFIKE